MNSIKAVKEDGMVEPEDIECLDFNPDACPECENDPENCCRFCGREAK